MIINANTRIGTIIKQKPEALERIIGIRPAFEKLRNPLLRKLIAGRTTIAMASKLGGCSVSDFFDTLQPLGFEIDKVTLPEAESDEPVPAFITTLSPEQLVELDVRPAIQSAQDPLKQILDKVNALRPGQVLKITNSFEPVPLVAMLEKKGYTAYINHLDKEQVDTYFYKATPAAPSKSSSPEALTTQTDRARRTDSMGGSAEGAAWEQVAARFKDRLNTVDVRALPMPQPMHTILQSLDELEPGRALFVYHKRIPVFLLSELTERGFDYRIREIKEGEVHMLIYKKEDDYVNQ